jgi:hypothetical protein
MTLIEMAIAFVLNHPTVTSAIIGPRTLEHLRSQLSAADVILDAEALDRIDAIITPGTVINPDDSSFANPALEPAARRCRPGDLHRTSKEHPCGTAHSAARTFRSRRSPSARG